VAENGVAEDVKHVMPVVRQSERVDDSVVLNYD
jgi:hypothetical protein